MDRSVAAVLRLFDEHHRPLYRFAWRLTGSVADAKDIVQECFLSLLKPGCGFDASRTAVRAYLFGAVRNQALRRLHRYEFHHESQAPPTAERECYAAEVSEAMARAIRQLPYGQRKPLFWRTISVRTSVPIQSRLDLEEQERVLADRRQCAWHAIMRMNGARGCRRTLRSGAFTSMACRE